MSVYSVLVFFHVVGAIVLVGGSLFAPLLGAAVRRTTSVTSLREWAAYLQRLSVVSGPAALVTFGTGLYLAFAGDWWGSGWLDVSLGLFVIAAILALGVIDPAMRRLLAAATDATDGPVDATLDVKRRDPRAAIAEWMLLGTDVAIVFLMTNKPGFAGAGVAAAVGLGLGAVLGLRERRHDRSALTVPAA